MRMSPAMRRRPAMPSIESTYIPAPVGGLDAISAGSAMDGAHCMRLYNLIAAEYGLRSRLGYREWCTGLTGASDNYVRTVIPFTGSTASGTNNKVFATTSSGIWDVTSSSASPTLVISFGITTGDAGYGVSTAFVTSAGHFAVYCDEVNGMYLYTETSGLWTKTAMGAGAGQISGVDPADFVFVIAFKNRLWFVEKDTDKSWYLATDAIAGAATVFRMGHKFRAGGPLVGLWDWTYDAGAGLDDSLVAVSGGGDVLVWQLADPSTPSGTLLRGVWYAGAVPAGRNIASNFGGDILLLSKAGLLSLSSLVSGTTDASQRFATAIIGPLFNSLALSTSTFRGWSIRLHPEDSSILITIPPSPGVATTQLAMSIARRSWSQYRDLPIYSSEIAGGKLYFGTIDGKVCINDGYIDGVTLADPNVYTPVQWALLTSFQNFGNGRQKQVQWIRPTILSESTAPAYSVAARYNYDLSELGTVSGSGTSSNSWDTAVWDTATWAGEYQASRAVSGTSGIGTDVAIAMRGTATSRTIVVGMEVAFTQGGLL